MDYFNEQGHLQEQAFIYLEQEQTEEIIRLEISEHLSFCDECLDNYLEYIGRCGEDKLIQPMKPMKNVVYNQIKMKLLGLVFNKYSSAVIAAGLTLFLITSGFLMPLDADYTDQKLLNIQESTQKVAHAATEATSSITNLINGIFKYNDRAVRAERNK